LVFLAKNNSTLQEDFHKLFLLMLFWTSVNLVILNI